MPLEDYKKALVALNNIDFDAMRAEVVNPTVIFTDDLDKAHAAVRNAGDDFAPFKFWDTEEDVYRQIGRFVVDFFWPGSVAIVKAESPEKVPDKWRQVAAVTYDYFGGQLEVTKNRHGENEILPGDKIGLALANEVKQ